MTHHALFCLLPKRTRQLVAILWAGMLSSGSAGSALVETIDPGRLFFTPGQRAQLEAARAHTASRVSQGEPAVADEAPAPLRYDGVVIRSDGKATRWIDGKPQLDGSAVSGMKPGQIRAAGKVYEPYQVLRPLAPSPAAPDDKESAP